MKRIIDRCILMSIVDKQLEAFNKQDLTTFLTCYADDIQVFHLESNNMITSGITQLEDVMKKSFSSNKTSHTAVVSRMYQNNLIINQEKITGHVEGKTITTISIYELKNDKISKVWFGGRQEEKV